MSDIVAELDNTPVNPAAVTVVEVERTDAEKVARFFALLIGMTIRVVAIWLIVPAISNIDVSFWQAVLATLLISQFLPIRLGPPRESEDGFKKRRARLLVDAYKVRRDNLLNAMDGKK